MFYREKNVLFATFQYRRRCQVFVSNWRKKISASSVQLKAKTLLLPRS
jgi:hypothetical protein